MAILKIARMGHPVLMGKARPVLDPTSAPVQQLVSDMVETMLDAPGIGLAAPQVHVPARVVVFRVPEERDGSENGVPLTVLINPEIEPVDEAMEEGMEGCLSLPEMVGLVSRHTKIRYRAFDLEGQVSWAGAGLFWDLFFCIPKKYYLPPPDYFDCTGAGRQGNNY